MRIIVLVIVEHENRVIFSVTGIFSAIPIPIPNTRVFGHTQKWVYPYHTHTHTIQTRNFIPEPGVPSPHISEKFAVSLFFM
jgi:hypothetical protein